MRIALTDRLDQLKAETFGEDFVSLKLDQAYGFDDILVFEVAKGAFVEVSIDPHVKTSIIYVPEGKISFQIPVNMKAKAYHPQAFIGTNHLISMKKVTDEVKAPRRNLAMNGLDKRWDTGYFPHAHANVVTRDEPWFEGKNAIDGHVVQDGHGAWPYQSWGGGLRDDLEFKLDFGRDVIIDEIIISLRADYVNDHDINWESGVVEFSDGTTLPIKMIKSSEGQSYKFDPKKVSWIKLNQLKREVSAAFSALVQIEVYGTEA